MRVFEVDPDVLLYRIVCKFSGILQADRIKDRIIDAKLGKAAIWDRPFSQTGFGNRNARHDLKRSLVFDLIKARDLAVFY